MAWNEDSTICLTVLSTLKRTEQIAFTVKFAAAGPMKMSDMLFFNSAASSDIIRGQALMEASTMDGIFTEAYGATYLGGYDQGKSIDALTAIMAQADKTVEDLSDEVATCYSITP